MKTAVDVVLLPSTEMTAQAIEINRELLKTAENKIVLDEQNCLPHISLCMGVLESADMPTAKNILNTIARETPALKLTAELMQADTIPTGKKVSGLRIKNTEQLQELQQTIMQQLWPYLSYEVNKAIFYHPQEIEDVTFTWVKGYAKKHDDPSLFHPHITVGFGETDAFADVFPMQFSAPTLALCQLGNYCTCRKVLGRFELDGAHKTINVGDL